MYKVYFLFSILFFMGRFFVNFKTTWNNFNNNMMMKKKHVIFKSFAKYFDAAWLMAYIYLYEI